MNQSQSLLNSDIIDISPSSNGSKIKYMVDLIDALEDTHAQDSINVALGLGSEEEVKQKTVNVILLDGAVPTTIPHHTLHEILSQRVRNLENKNDENYGSLYSILIPGENAITKQINFHINQVSEYINELIKMEIFDATEIDFFQAQLNDLVLQASEDYNELMFDEEEVDNMQFEEEKVQKILQPTLEEFKEFEEVLIRKLTF